LTYSFIPATRPLPSVNWRILPRWPRAARPRRRPTAPRRRPSSSWPTRGRLPAEPSWRVGGARCRWRCRQLSQVEIVARASYRNSAELQHVSAPRRWASILL